MKPLISLLFAFFLSAQTIPSTVRIPVTLRVSAGKPNWVEMTWTPSTSDNVVGYNVYRNTISGSDSGSSYYFLASVGKVNMYVDMAVTPGQTYYYVVRAVDDNDYESDNSGEAVAAIPKP